MKAKYLKTVNYSGKCTQFHRTSAFEGYYRKLFHDLLIPLAYVIFIFAEFSGVSVSQPGGHFYCTLVCSEEEISD